MFGLLASRTFMQFNILYCIYKTEMAQTGAFFFTLIHRSRTGIKTPFDLFVPFCYSLSRLEPDASSFETRWKFSDIFENNIGAYFYESLIVQKMIFENISSISQCFWRLSTTIYEQVTKCGQTDETMFQICFRLPIGYACCECLDAPYAHLKDQIPLQSIRRKIFKWNPWQFVIKYKQTYFKSTFKA